LKKWSAFHGFFVGSLDLSVVFWGRVSASVRDQSTGHDEIGNNSLLRSAMRLCVMDFGSLEGKDKRATHALRFCPFLL
jgi:hypothetical protein